MALENALATVVIQVVEETLTEKGMRAPTLTLESSIDKNLGLDSLDWAAIVIRLEEETGIDPFQQGMRQDLRTIRDFVDVYQAEMS